MRTIDRAAVLIVMAIATALPAQAQQQRATVAATKPVVVALYEVRSTVPEMEAPGATDMFMTALVRSGAFVVAERQRLADGAQRERQLAGVDAATAPFTPARWVFEVAVSEATSGAAEDDRGIRVGAMSIERGRTRDTIALDVRVVDARTGLVVDALRTARTIESTSRGISGAGRLIGQLRSLAGKATPIVLDVDTRSTRREGVDQAVRRCIETAVAELARRLPGE